MRAILILIILNLIVMVALLIDAKTTSDDAKVNVHHPIHVYAVEHLQPGKEHL
ncbi:hypothetical protein ACQCU1_21715 [Sutcliffiella horikoshii]|uniref:hypothetical protein n=1 Tax=Sutcliffiella horikoshii TaxID=79883 RepID=UPI0012F98103|nr:hypothetical protein [Sutcliffiella horikoshii]